ncbi:MAG: UDP-N-acetylmuramate dehydrogenase [Deltaproteobacteria bacterium]|nr:UDP-N-acetylmuramate dehydrogenase [Deltaproteobacteria bacterium]
MQQTELSQLFGESVQFNEPLAPYTSIKVGGPADLFLTPKDRDELKRFVLYTREKEIPLFILGAGSNLLIRDGGIRGAVIFLKNFSHVELISETFLTAEAGLFVPKLVEWTASQGLTGLEPLIGVPGSLGGAIAMNAGTRQGEIGSLVEEVTGLTKEGEEVRIPKSKLEFKYRSSKIPRGVVILSAILKLEKGERTEIENRIREFKEYRLKTQPLNYPNLGSVFKNPLPGFAGQMIEEAGLKEVRIGNARISPKHANFIINEGGATAKDIQILINLVKDKVKDRFSVNLEPEVKIVGEER